MRLRSNIHRITFMIAALVACLSLAASASAGVTLAGGGKTGLGGPPICQTTTYKIPLGPTIKVTTCNDGYEHVSVYSVPAA